MGTAQCDVVVRLTDGRVLTRHIEHVIGSLEKPMTEAALEAKFLDLADGILAADRTKALIQKCWAVERQPDAGSLALAAAV
jgi:2-methylcitrate dehydratase PrpD